MPGMQAMYITISDYSKFKNMKIAQLTFEFLANDTVLSFTPAGGVLTMMGSNLKRKIFISKIFFNLR